MTDPSPLNCPDCGAPMALRSGRHGPFYSCTRYPACKGSHGAHPDGRPLGTPADAATRAARVAAHRAFDRLWSRAVPGSRKRAYAWLASELGVAVVHMGEMDAATCARVVELCERAG